MPQNCKNERSSLKNERYLCSIWSIPWMSEKSNSYQKELSSSDHHRPSNKPKRLHTYFWATLYNLVLLGIFDTRAQYLLRILPCTELLISFLISSATNISNTKLHLNTSASVLNLKHGCIILWYIRAPCDISLWSDIHKMAFLLLYCVHCSISSTERSFIK